MKIDPYKHKEKYIQWKKEINGKIPELKEKRSKFSYQLIYHRDPKKLGEEIKKLIKQNPDSVPLLLWLFREG